MSRCRLLLEVSRLDLQVRFPCRLRLLCRAEGRAVVSSPLSQPVAPFSLVLVVEGLPAKLEVVLLILTGQQEAQAGILRPDITMRGEQTVRFSECPDQCASISVAVSTSATESPLSPQQAGQEPLLLASSCQRLSDATKSLHSRYRQEYANLRLALQSRTKEEAQVQPEGGIEAEETGNSGKAAQLREQLIRLQNSSLREKERQARREETYERQKAELRREIETLRGRQQELQGLRRKEVSQERERRERNERQVERLEEKVFLVETCNISIRQESELRAKEFEAGLKELEQQRDQTQLANQALQRRCAELEEQLEASVRAKRDVEQDLLGLLARHESLKQRLETATCALAELEGLATFYGLDTCQGVGVALSQLIGKLGKENRSREQEARQMAGVVRQLQMQLELEQAARRKERRLQQSE